MAAIRCPVPMGHGTSNGQPRTPRGATRNALIAHSPPWWLRHTSSRTTSMGADHLPASNSSARRWSVVDRAAINWRL